MDTLIKHQVRSTYGPDGVVLLDIDHGRMVSINPVGAKIWQGLECNMPIATIIENISAEFEVPRETVAADVTDFLRALSRHSLIEWAESAHFPKTAPYRDAPNGSAS